VRLVAAAAVVLVAGALGAPRLAPLVGLTGAPPPAADSAPEGRERPAPAAAARAPRPDAEPMALPTRPPVLAAAESLDAPRAAPTPDGMLLIAPGAFWMGCNEQVDRGCFDNERPGRRLEQGAFRIDRTEVTVHEYGACVRDGACSRDSFTASTACNWGKEGRDRHPINCVSWTQAQAYCAWAGRRLPTDAEWEKAARGTDGRVYPWGNGWDPKRANAERLDDGFPETSPVGSFPAGAAPCGALDMAGNVFEWTDGWADERRGFRSLRGGSWNFTARDLRASNRYGDAAESHRADVGFRCAR
jgi:serine/threonine-protein kinase